MFPCTGTEANAPVRAFTQNRGHHHNVYNGGLVNVTNQTNGQSTFNNTNANTNNQTLTNGLYQTQTLQNFTQLTTSSQQIVNNNNSQTNSSTTNNQSTTVVNNNNSSSSETHNTYTTSNTSTSYVSNITNITNITNIYECCNECGPETSVPEPASFALFAAGLLALWGFARFRRRRALRRR